MHALVCSIDEFAIMIVNFYATPYYVYNLLTGLIAIDLIFVDMMLLLCFVIIIVIFNPSVFEFVALSHSAYF